MSALRRSATLLPSLNQFSVSRVSLKLQRFLFSFLVLITIPHKIFGQAESGKAGTALGTAMGPIVFNGTTQILWRHMKEPDGVFSIGPRQLNFSNVAVNQHALNVFTISNGTPSAAEIQELQVQSGGFHLWSAVKLPLVMPPNAELILTVEFLPQEVGNHSGKIIVMSKSVNDGAVHRLNISLRGKGISP